MLGVGLGFHLILMKYLLFALFFLVFNNCSPDKQDVQAVPTTASDIDKAQKIAFGIKTPESILAGEFVYTLKTQQIFSSQEPTESLLDEQAITVVERNDFGNYIEFTIVKEHIDHTLPDSPVSKFKDVLLLKIKEESSSPEQSSDGSDNLPELEDPSPIVVEFFNLKVKQEQIRKPKLVTDRDPCDETNVSCLIDVSKITYDVRVTLPPELPRITSFETWISQDVPYLAAVLKNCFQTVLTIDSARPVIRQCTTVVDYKLGVFNEKK